MTVAALVTGNTVVLKPSEESPTIAARMVEILYEAGVPKDVLNFVTGLEKLRATRSRNIKTRFVAFTVEDVGLLISEAAGSGSNRAIGGSSVRVARNFSKPRHKIQHIFRYTASYRISTILAAIVGDSSDGFSYDRIPRHQCRHRHARRNRRRKIPRRNHRADAQRNIRHEVSFVLIRRHLLRPRQPLHLSSIKFAKINRFRRVRVRLDPRFCRPRSKSTPKFRTFPFTNAFRRAKKHFPRAFSAGTRFHDSNAFAAASTAPSPVPAVAF